MIAMSLYQRAAASDGYPPFVIENGTVYIPALNGTLITPNNCTNTICSLAYGELRYLPSLGGNTAYLAIFAAFLVVQLGLGIHYRTWGFMVGMVCGLLLEVVGYLGRILLHGDDFNFNYFVIYLVCLTIAPAFLSAAIYLCLSRLVVAYGPSIARFSPKTYTLTFVCCDLMSLILQATGGAIAATSDGHSSGSAGVNIMIAGLAFQVASLTLFMVLSADFIWSVHRASPHALDPAFKSLRERKFFRLFPYALALATLTIFVRCCFRVAELEHGFRGSLANNQTLFMIFEGPMIMIAVLCLTVIHAGVAFGGREGWKSVNWTWKRQQADNASETESESYMMKEPRRSAV